MTSAKEAAFELWRAFGARDPNRIRAALTPDARWIAPAGNATSIASGATADSLLSPDGIVAFITGAYTRVFPAGAQVEFTRVIADGDIVVFEQNFRARVVNGRDYENRYCWVIEVKDGKVHELREYMDTHAGFAMIFGEGAPEPLIW